MNASADPVTIALTGMWPFIMISSAVLTFPASALLLGVYRRAVVRGMNASRAGSIPSAPATARSAAPAMPLRFVSLNANAASPSHLPGPWHAAAVYLAAGAAYALTMTAAWLLATRDHQIGPIKVIFIFWSYYWPAMLAVVLVAAEDRARKASVVLGYFAAYVALTVVELTLSPEFTWKQAAGFWIIQNAPATVLLYLFLIRRIRSVGPLVLVFAIVALLGSELAISFLGASDARMSTAVEIGSAIGLGGIGVFVATLLLGFLVFALLGWMVLRWIGARYAAKKLSDESLTADAIFLIFAINASIGLVFQHWMWIAAALVSFAAYKAIAQIGFRLIPKTSSPKKLLLLRVFALGARSEPLFDVVRKQWLRGGSIAMIAGPDLVTSAVQPHEFLGFLSGQLSRTFIDDDASLERRVAAIDPQSDPDGRYRVTEFFCHVDTWQRTMRRLVAVSDAVLMDLRSFSASNQGCVYELGRLLDAIDLGRVVFVIDKTTDRRFLEATLEALWSSLAAESPNRSVAESAARFFEVRSLSAAETQSLIGHLCPA